MFVIVLGRGIDKVGFFVLKLKNGGHEGILRKMAKW